MANKPPVNPRRRFALLRREEGQAAFEFVLVLPVCIFFLLLMVDMGIMTYQYVSVSNAVREGARFGAVNCGGECTVGDVASRTVTWAPVTKVASPGPSTAPSIGLCSVM